MPPEEGSKLKFYSDTTSNSGDKPTDQLTVDMFTSMFDKLGIETEMGKKAFLVAIEHIQVLDKKHKDYGPRNISDFGEIGVLVRTNDKVQRLINLLNSDGPPQNESPDDSWLDISNYGIIARLVRKGLWR